MLISIETSPLRMRLISDDSGKVFLFIAIIEKNCKFDSTPQGTNMIAKISHQFTLTCTDRSSKWFPAKTQRFRARTFDI